MTGEQTRFLADATAALGASLDYKVTLARVAELAVPFLSDWCAIDVAEAGQPGRFARIAVAHVEPGKAELTRDMQARYPPDPGLPHGYPKVLRTGEPDFWPEVPEAGLRAAARDPEHLRLMLEIGYRSYMSVPLAARGRTLGTMTFVIARSGRRFSETDLAIAVDLGRHAGLALDNARLFQEVETARRRASLLAEASRLLAGSLELSATLPLVAALVVPELGDDCAIEIDDDGGARRRFCGFDADPGAVRLDVPVVANGELLGTMTFTCMRDDFRYGKAESAFAEDLANRVALAIANARLYAHARDSVRAREEFLAVASHELRTPLTALMLVVRMLRALPEGQAREQLPAKLEVAERQLERITRTITRLFDLTRAVTSGDGTRVGLELEEMDLLATVKEVMMRFEDDLARAGCVTTVSGESAVGQWNKFRVEQVVTNLVSNAMKFGRGKPIEITVGIDGACARLLVADHGAGVPEADAGRIFDRFARGSQALEYEGLGLGLHVVAKVLATLGGTIDVRPTPGRGATFVVELPRKP